MTTPNAEDLRDNKREMFDGMRAYHQSEISHANHAVTMLLAIAAAAGAVALALLFPERPVKHLTEIAWGLAFAVTAFAVTIAVTSTIKIGTDHESYRRFGEEYVLTSRLMGFYDQMTIAGKSVRIKDREDIGHGKGYRKTQAIIWAFTVVLCALTFLFASLSADLV